MAEAVANLGSHIAIERTAGGYEAALYLPLAGRVRGFGRRASRDEACEDAKREADDRGLNWVDRTGEAANDEA